MEKTSQWLSVEDGHQIFLQRWRNPSTTPTCVVQIAHGMAEHIDRYDAFARFLVNNGMVVYGHDHRGHGKTGEHHGVMGYFSDHSGFEQVTKDVQSVTTQIRNHYSNTPIVLFGHSMGSFLVRRAIQLPDTQIDGVILSGTGYYSRLVTKVAKLVAKLEIYSKGKTSPSPFLHSLSFGSFNKQFKNAVTDYDWLSRDARIVNEYVDDPYTGFIPTTSFFYDLFTGLDTIHRNKEMATIPKQLPLLVISGDKDPVGNGTRGVKKVIDQYYNNNVTNIDVQFYKDARHELLQETNKKEVFNDILEWIQKVADEHLSQIK
ncbi:alpha/beta fold hydrolase [Aquibacillus sediminis]|uniref:alpha/beta fold hydrolase n=1 Tax=Aquibacillus sediminis TaxID=2574734 RepID=UPI0011091A6D|nr:alpha/beta hydrolase [Aquibacillus sediminis]